MKAFAVLLALGCSQPARRTPPPKTQPDAGACDCASACDCFGVDDPTRWEAQNRAASACIAANTPCTCKPCDAP